MSTFNFEYDEIRNTFNDDIPLFLYNIIDSKVLEKTLDDASAIYSKHRKTDSVIKYFFERPYR